MAWLDDVSEEIADEFASAQSACPIALTFAERRNMQAFEPVKPWDIGRLKEWIAKHPDKRREGWERRLKGGWPPAYLTPAERRERRNESRRVRYAANIETERQKTIRRMKALADRKRAERAMLRELHRARVLAEREARKAAAEAGVVLRGRPFGLHERSYSRAIVACVTECPGISGAAIRAIVAPSLLASEFYPRLYVLVSQGYLSKRRTDAGVVFDLPLQLSLLSEAA